LVLAPIQTHVGNHQTSSSSSGFVLLDLRAGGTISVDRERRKEEPRWWRKRSRDGTDHISLASIGPCAIDEATNRANLFIERFKDVEGR
jgi:hypothetical protein